MSNIIKYKFKNLFNVLKGGAIIYQVNYDIVDNFTEEQITKINEKFIINLQDIIKMLNPSTINWTKYIVLIDADNQNKLAVSICQENLFISFDICASEIKKQIINLLTLIKNKTVKLHINTVICKYTHIHDPIYLAIYYALINKKLLYFTLDLDTRIQTKIDVYKSHTITNFIKYIKDQKEKTTTLNKVYNEFIKSKCKLKKYKLSLDTLIPAFLEIAYTRKIENKQKSQINMNDILVKMFCEILLNICKNGIFYTDITYKLKTESTE